MNLLIDKPELERRYREVLVLATYDTHLSRTQLFKRTKLSHEITRRFLETNLPVNLCLLIRRLAPLLMKENIWNKPEYLEDLEYMLRKFSLFTDITRRPVREKDVGPRNIKLIHDLNMRVIPRLTNSLSLGKLKNNYPDGRVPGLKFYTEVPKSMQSIEVAWWQNYRCQVTIPKGTRIRVLESDATRNFWVTVRNPPKSHALWKGLLFKGVIDDPELVGCPLGTISDWGSLV